MKKDPDRVVVVYIFDFFYLFRIFSGFCVFFSICIVKGSAWVFIHKRLLTEHIPDTAQTGGVSNR